MSSGVPALKDRVFARAFSSLPSRSQIDLVREEHNYPQPPPETIFPMSNLSPVSSHEEYDEATTNHYSQELRAKLARVVDGNLDPSKAFQTVANQDVPKWRLGLMNRFKVLLTSQVVEKSQAVIELIGKFKTLSCFAAFNKNYDGLNNAIVPEAFVFFHLIPVNKVCISVDCRKYGNAARFIRRSCYPTCEIRHAVRNGSVHLYIVPLRRLNKDEEITIPHEFKTFASTNISVQDPPLACSCPNPYICAATPLTPLTPLTKPVPTQAQTTASTQKWIELLATIGTEVLTDMESSPSPPVRHRSPTRSPPTSRRSSTNSPPPPPITADVRKLTREERKDLQAWKLFEKLENKKRKKDLKFEKRMKEMQHDNGDVTHY